MKKFIWYFFWFFAFCSFFSVAFADVVVSPPTTNLPGGTATVEVTEKIVPQLIAYTIGLVWVLAIIAVTYSGVQMFLSAGDEGKFKKARNIMITAFIGVAIAGLAYGIVSLVTNLSLK